MLRLDINTRYGFATRKTNTKYKIQNVKAAARNLNVFFARIVFYIFEIQYVKADRIKKY